jgi:hypothetical protein
MKQDRANGSPLRNFADDHRLRLRPFILHDPGRPVDFGLIGAFSPMHAGNSWPRGPHGGPPGLLKGAARPSDSMRITAAAPKLLAITNGFPLRHGGRFAKLE